MFSGCPEGWEAVELGFAPSASSGKGMGGSFAPSLLLVGIPARNPGIVGREGPRLGLAHFWEGDDPEQLQSTPEIVEFWKGDTSHDPREEKYPR